MKPILTSILFLFCLTTTNAQQPSKLDSLKKVLAHLPAEGRSFAGDTLRIRVLCEMGEEEGNPKKSHEYLSAAKTIAEKQNDKKGQLLALEKFSQLYEYQPARVIEYNMKGLAIAENLKDYPKVIKFTNQIRNKYFALGDNENTMKFAKYNFAVNKEHGNLETQLISMNNIGIVYFQMKKYDMALNYFFNIHRLNSHLKSMKVENAYLINSAKIYVIQKQNKKALINLQEALEIKDGYKDKISFIANEIALIYLSENNLNEAIKFAQISEKANNGLSDSYKIGTYETFTKIYKKIKGREKYIQYLEKFTSLSLKEDSIKSSKLTDFINLDYVAEKQLMKINDLNINLKENEFKNKLLIGGILTSIGVLITILFFNRIIKKKSQEISIQNQRIEELNKSLEFKVKERTSELSEANKELIKKNFEISEALFKGQTIERKRVAAELHDNLGSTLSALKWRLGALDSDNLNKKERVIYESIKSMMNNAYDDVRNLSHNLLPTEFESKGLIGALQKLINDINENKKIRFKFNSKGNTASIDKKIGLEIYSICLELITNILKHSEANSAYLSIIKLQDKIEIEIYDNGKGIMENSKHGKGIESIIERSNTIGLQFSIENYNEKGTKIYLSSN